MQHTIITDIEIFCYKQHLHARCSIDALVEYSSRNGTDQPFNNYKSVFLKTCLLAANHKNGLLAANHKNGIIHLGNALPMR